MKSPPAEPPFIPPTDDDKRNVVVVVGGDVVGLSTALWLKIQDDKLIVHVIDPDEHAKTPKSYPDSREGDRLSVDCFPHQIEPLVEISLQLHEGFSKHENYRNPGKVASEPVYYTGGIFYGILLRLGFYDRLIPDAARRGLFRLISPESLYEVLYERCKSCQVIMHRPAIGEMVGKDTMRVSYPRSLKKSLEIQSTRYLLIPSDGSSDPVPILQKTGFMSEEYKVMRINPDGTEGWVPYAGRHDEWQFAIHGTVQLLSDTVELSNITGEVTARLLGQPVHDPKVSLSKENLDMFPVLAKIPRDVMESEDGFSSPVSPEGGGVWFAGGFESMEYLLCPGAGFVLSHMLKGTFSGVDISTLGMDWRYE